MWCERGCSCGVIRDEARPTHGLQYFRSTPDAAFQRQSGGFAPLRTSEGSGRTMRTPTFYPAPEDSGLLPTEWEVTQRVRWPAPSPSKPSPMPSMRRMRARCSGGPAAHRVRLLEAFAHATARVFSHGLAKKECEGMGSTAIAGLMNGEVLHLCHVGDARGYHLSKGKFRRVTNDHSLVLAKLVVSGLLNPDQARLHPHRGRVTQAIGMPSVKPEVTSLTLKPADRVLLCSDGLWEALPEPEIGEIVASTGSMLDLASMLVDRANAGGAARIISPPSYTNTARGPDGVLGRDSSYYSTARRLFTLSPSRRAHANRRKG